jgi:hypothetical protein
VILVTRSTNKEPTMPAALLDLTGGHDSGLSLAVVTAMASLGRFAFGGPDACGGLPAALDRLHDALGVVEAARRIDSDHRDLLRQMLGLLVDHAWALAQVVERHPEALHAHGTPINLARAAEGFARLCTAAGDLLAAVEALDAI